MKAIQTKYKGYHFRSRLEARWAVFFDALGIRWEYEPEGFDSGFGELYLPDFRICDTFLEVKPNPPTFFERRKLLKLLDIKGEGKGTFLVGTPGDHAAISYVPLGMRVDADWFRLPGASEVSLEDSSNRFVCIPYTIPSEVRHGRLVLSTFEKEWIDECGGIRNAVANTERLRLLNAFDAARSARFEFGESGATV